MTYMHPAVAAAIAQEQINQQPDDKDLTKWSKTSCEIFGHIKGKDGECIVCKPE